MPALALLLISIYLMFMAECSLVDIVKPTTTLISLIAGFCGLKGVPGVEIKCPLGQLNSAPFSQPNPESQLPQNGEPK